MGKSLDKQAIINLLIVAKVYIQRTMPLLEPGVGLITDPLPKQDDGRLLLMEFETAIKTLQSKKPIDSGQNEG